MRVVFSAFGSYYFLLCRAFDRASKGRVVRTDEGLLVTEATQFKFGNNHVAIGAAVGPILVDGGVEFTKWFTGVSFNGGQPLFPGSGRDLRSYRLSTLNGTPLDANSLANLGRVGFEAAQRSSPLHPGYAQNFRLRPQVNLTESERRSCCG
jgi:hypothetical protein